MDKTLYYNKAAFKFYRPSIRIYKTTYNLPKRVAWLLFDGLFTWQCKLISLNETMMADLIDGIDKIGRPYQEYNKPSVIIVDTKDHIIVDSL